MTKTVIPYDGMPQEEEEHVVHEEINEDEMIAFILIQNKDRELTYNDVKAILKAETTYLHNNGFIDMPES
ncbi:hypothetical protein [Oceanobacillus damuensis]|uniref:hypothetical protein n=1 Tax=Oceanobacillus damuensis TaxID=937928 RepID=UPI000832E1D7|nr:hypothetical protein [Oceanobacillus damuensis]